MALAIKAGLADVTGTAINGNAFFEKADTVRATLAAPVVARADRASLSSLF
jgi:hypothetical protein